MRTQGYVPAAHCPDPKVGDARRSRSTPVLSLKIVMGWVHAGLRDTANL